MAKQSLGLVNEFRLTGQFERSPWSAFVLNRDDSLGSIEVGKHADFAVLDDDPYEVAPEFLKDISILGTVLAGNVHVADSS